MSPPNSPVIIDGRFVLEPEPPRVGGTAHVHPARDFQNSGAEVAVKLYDGTAIGDDLRRECFLRERAALETLTHPHIVRLVSAGYDKHRLQHYLALEWLETDLVGRLRARPARITWPEFARTILRPLLQALSAAHARRILHRDIKPANVMVALDGTVRLTDFGVAKLMDSMRAGLTVRELHSRPYAPPERDGGDLDARSDLYSLGVTAIDVLSDLTRRLSHDADPAQALAEIGLPDDAHHYLAALVAQEPDRRPFTAKLALAELDKILPPESEGIAITRRLRVAITHSVIEQARVALDVSDPGETRRRLIADLSADQPVLARDRRDEGGWEDESAVRLDMVGDQLLYNARFDREGTGTLVLTGVKAVPSSMLERRRDNGLVVEHELTFDNYRWPDQRDDADELIEALVAHQLEHAEARAARTESELFGRWRNLLEAKTELENQREDALPYDGVTKDGRVLTFSTTGVVDERHLDQTRRVRMSGGGAVVGTVVEVGNGEIGLAVERGNINGVPARGQLLVDRQASRRAIDRQRRALADVRDGDAARADLGELLVHPERAAPLEPITLSAFFSELDRPKQKAVEVALASPDFTLVEGPPGTGKTTFIVELIAQLLAGRPRSRILLSAQTHVAVDNAAVKLDGLEGVRVVRVGPAAKIDVDAQGLTVPEQLRQWHREAQVQARDWLSTWGQARGISAEALHAYSTAAELSTVEFSVEKLRTRLGELSIDEERLLERLTDPDRATSTTSTTTGELVTDETDELAAVQDEATTCASELSARDAERSRVAGELAGMLRVDTLDKPDELEQALRTRFPVTDEDLGAYRALVELQDEWLVRFGQGEGFTEALLSSAQVVAGTCVGLAGALDDLEPFDVAIVDEVSKATPTEALVPMARSRRWVLVGDERQLPPYVDMALTEREILDSHNLRRQDLEETLFGQLATLPADRKVVLSVQHRMLEPIGDLVSACFYRNTLRSSRPARSNRRSLIEALPDPVTWYSTVQMAGRRERSSGTTYWNEAELRVVRKLVNRLQRHAAAADEHLRIAVITGYSEQARRIQRDLRPQQEDRWTHVSIDVHPVDSFQGQQRDVVIYSVTRSNKENNLGFLRSERRINVALSRAEDALVIVGDARFCAHARGGDNPFAKVLDYVKSHNGCSLLEPRW